MRGSREFKQDRPKKPKRPNGRPQHKPTDQTREAVRMLVVMGKDQEFIAKFVGVNSPTTLRRHYRRQLDHGKTEVDVMVMNGIVMRAVGGPRQDWEKIDSAMARFYANVRMGLKEKTEVGFSGAVGTYDAAKLDGLSDEQLKAFFAILTILAPESAPDPGSRGGDPET